MAETDAERLAREAREQRERHVRLPFSMSNSRALRPFDLIHCDLWTSLVVGVSG